MTQGSDQISKICLKVCLFLTNHLSTEVSTYREHIISIWMYAVEREDGNFYGVQSQQKLEIIYPQAR